MLQPLKRKIGNHIRFYRGGTSQIDQPCWIDHDTRYADAVSKVPQVVPMDLCGLLRHLSAMDYREPGLQSQELGDNHDEKNLGLVLELCPQLVPAWDPSVAGQFFQSKAMDGRWSVSPRLLP